MCVCACHPGQDVVWRLYRRRRALAPFTDDPSLRLRNMVKIDGQRENYRPAGLRSAVLYFVLNDLVAIDPMYQCLGKKE